jgi:alginate O-acetyltransferase complex protein AlgI
VDCLKKQKYYQFPDYLVFVSFFPHLVAGPILRHDVTIPQIESKKFGKPSARKIYIAILFFSIGMFKKVIIADSIAVYVDKLFADVNSLSMLDAWAAAILYTFQIFFDFSAYSEMAIGLALLMNVRIPFNFNSPYKSTSIVDFWRRWHISLSSFLRDYLYIPLGGNRKGPWRRYVNLFVTMLLGGLWHGAAWTFVIWGGLHGIYLSINHAFAKTRLKLPKFISWSLTFLAVVIAWVFFRAQHLATAVSMLKTMLGLNHTAIWQTQIFSRPLMVIGSLSLLIVWTLSAPNTQQLAIGKTPSLRVGLIIMGLLIVGILGLGQSDHFIYFQF